MNITLNNCNNIESGNVEIVENTLNVKYAINGTGKTTIGKAISAKVLNDQSKLLELLPFKYSGVVQDNPPTVTGTESLKNVMIFNEDYVNQYVFQKDEVIKDSFEIFVRTDNYDRHLAEIEKLLREINITFQNHPELDFLIQMFSQFIEGFGKSKSGYSAAGAIAKGIGKGNKINNIPAGLEAYSPYLRNENNVGWIKWQLDGKQYLDIATQCPYCTNSIDKKKDLIVKVGEEFDAKTVEQLNKMIIVFKNLLPYFSEETAKNVKTIIENASGITDQQREYLLEIKTQVHNLLGQLNRLKYIGYHSLKDAEKIADELNQYKLNISLYSHLQSEETKEKINIINHSLDAVLESAGKLQGAVAQQRIEIRRTIEQNKNAINGFMSSAGYKYSVDINETDDHQYKMILTHNDSLNTSINTVKDHLSYGERNAFALVLFMFSAIKENPDLIILDDPISSFDGNKKYAIIHMLFLGEVQSSFRNKTVLLLTHEFSTVIDIIYTLPSKFTVQPQASFLSVRDGVLREKRIKKENIVSFHQIALDNIQSVPNTIIKLIYMRRLIEIENPDSMAWHLLSNLFHSDREVPKYRVSSSVERDMTESEIADATNEIQQLYPAFDYQIEYGKASDISQLRKEYNATNSNYEKLQLYRLINKDNSSNDIVRRFVNETYHVENDYLFQLNPREYDTVPEYIIKECDKEINELFPPQTTEN